MLSAGQLNRRLRVEASSNALDTYGEPVGGWSEIDTVWGSFAPGEVSEAVVGARERSRARATFVVRWREDFGAAERLIFDGTIYDILGAKAVGRREFLEILAVELGPYDGKLVAGDVEFALSLAGSLDRERRLSGDVASTTTLAGNLTSGADLAGDISTTASLAGSLDRA